MLEGAVNALAVNMGETPAALVIAEVLCAPITLESRKFPYTAMQRTGRATASHGGAGHQSGEDDGGENTQPVVDGCGHTSEVALLEIEGERVAVLPPGALDKPGWTWRKRPAVKLSRE